MYLLINDKTLQKAWGGSTEFWFSRVDYCIHSSSDLKCNDDSTLVQSGFIPFLNVTDEEVMRSYIKSLGNKKLENTFSALPSDQFVETFWKYFNAYSQISNGYDEFETDFVLNKIVEWCNSNSVEYKVEK